MLFASLSFTLANASHVGNLLIVDPGSSRIVEYDHDDGHLVGDFVPPQIGLGVPQGTAIGVDYKLYVADSSNRKIKRFDAHSGQFLNDFITTPTGTGPAYSLASVASIRFVANSLYVLANAPTRLLKFNALTGAFIKTVFTAASTSEFSGAKDFIFLENLSRVLVVGSTNKGARYDVATGAFVDYFLNPTGATTEMQDPFGLALGPDGRIWVSSSNDKILRYNASTGALIDNNFLKGGVISRPSQIIFEMESDAVYVLSRGTSSTSVSRYSMTTGNVRDDTLYIDCGLNGPMSPRFMLFARNNLAPVASAGADQSVTSGDTVLFNATGSSDADGDALSLSWSQVSGPAVTMANTSSSWPSFVAPSVTVPTTLVFQVSVSDGEYVSTDSVQVIVTPLNLDRDNDGLPNDWELANGLNPDDPNDAALDSDSDGQKNSEEYASGTDPRNPNSVFRIVGTSAANGNIVITFTSRSDRIYGIYERTDYGAWSGPYHEVVGAAGTTTIARQMVGERRQYRISVRMR